MPAYFPLFVNMEHKKVLVFGAGNIAARRIKGLLRYQADITVVAPHIQKEVARMQESHAGQLMVQCRAYRPGEILGGHTDFVLAATDNNQVNNAICIECRKAQIPVNHAGDRSQCDFYFPALVEQDNLLIGVASIDGDHKAVAQFSRKLRGHFLGQNAKGREGQDI